MLTQICFLTGTRNTTLINRMSRLSLHHSRAFATTSRDSKKMPNRDFIETELKENPEFFKAFPHL